MLTEICFTPVQDGPSLAEGHVVIEGRFKVSGIRVVRGTHGLFVSWPSFREAPDRSSPRFPIFEILTDRDRWAAEVEILNAVVQILPEEAPRG